MRIEREWAMPSHETFTIAPIRKLIDRYMNGDLLDNRTAGEWIDPFCRQSVFKTRCKFTNDLNPEFAGTHNVDALEFLKGFDAGSFDGVLFDPPFSAIQAKEEYNGFGGETDTCRSFWADRKREAARVLKAGAIAICCGWTSLGLGKVNGMEMIEVLLVNHGQQNDTIVTVEKRV